MEIIIGDGSLVTYDGGDNAARALYFCVSHQVDEEENCVQEVLRMSRVLNETATSKKSVWCATGDESCTLECAHTTRRPPAGGVFDLLPDLAVAGAAPFEFSNHVNLERGVLRPLGDAAGRRLCDALREGGDVCALDSVSELYRDGDGGGVCATV
ncbi:hypothetical protein JL721_9587 [Aureococcus anophagefferens]|nr:hypothetical protein JL721_9587 [Aureococcus anophagefferens]